MAHSVSPWTCNDHGIVYDAQGGQVAMVIGMDDTRLIAAAPRLLEALLIAQNTMRAPLDEWKGECERVALDAARAAIADATGEAQ